MAKDPAFLFYPNDYIGGTMGMTFEEKGAYMELLMLQFNRGHMTKHMIGQTVGQLWDNIKDKFEVDNGGLFYNVRLEEEKEKRKAFTSSRRNNKEGKNQYSKSGHMTSHMEDVNENESRVINKDKEKLFKPDFELFISACFKYLGIPYTQGDPSRHGIESPIRKWLLTQDPKAQLRNLNAYVKVIKEKQYRVKTIEKLLEKLEGYNFCQDLSTYVPVTNGQPKKTEAQLADDRKQEEAIREVYRKARNKIGK